MSTRPKAAAFALHCAAMRKTIVALVVLIPLWLGYLIWPFASLFAVVRAAQAADSAAIAQHVNFPALRRSLAGQIIDTYARLTGTRLDRAGITVGVASSFADPLLEKLLAPATLAELLRSGWPKSVLAEAPPGIGGLDQAALGNAWQLFLNSDYGIGEVRITLPAGQPKEKQYRVDLALDQWTWKLSGLLLPRETQERLARELMKQQGKLGLILTPRQQASMLTSP
jgi:hypothetical protein